VPILRPWAPNLRFSTLDCDFVRNARGFLFYTPNLQYLIV
jgi:hypothetical protein